MGRSCASFNFVAGAVLRLASDVCGEWLGEGLFVAGGWWLVMFTPYAMSVCLQLRKMAEDGRGKGVAGSGVFTMFVYFTLCVWMDGWMVGEELLYWNYQRDY